ncbi:MAG: hypothetical protein V3V96_14265 [Acidiferrobacterales bacterium]
MSSSHHGTLDDRQQAALTRFNDELDGIARREWPNGRLAADDDGEFSYAIIADVKHCCIRLVFAKPTRWIGLDRESAEVLRDQLTEKLLELRGITPTS